MASYQQQVGEQAAQFGAGAGSAFGGSRAAVAQAQLGADAALGGAGLQANLLSQGFSQANQLAAQAFGQQGQMAQNQFGLSNFGRGSMGQDISALGNLGSLSQGLTQANLTANQQAAKTAAYEPYGRLQQYGAGLTGLAGGMASAYAEPAPVQSPLNTALNSAIGIGGLFGKIYG